MSRLHIPTKPAPALFNYIKQMDSEESWRRIVNLYTAWLWQLAGILEQLEMRRVAELRGQSGLLIYLERMAE